MKPELSNAPLTKWTRTLEFIKEDDREDYLEIVNHPNLDLKVLFAKEIKFRKQGEINLTLLMEGLPGSGKSLASLAVAKMIKPAWTPKGNMYYSNDDLIDGLKNAPEDTVAIKDEDPNEGGQGSGSMANALANLESACARFGQISIIVVNPYETSHVIAFKLDTSRQESRRHGNILNAVVVDVYSRSKDQVNGQEDWLRIGKMELEVPEEIVPEYKAGMKKFKDAFRRTGGIGIKRDVYRRYAYLIPEIRSDPYFYEIPTKKDGFFTEDHCSYISEYHGVNQDSARLFLLRAWRELKVQNAKPPIVK